MNRVELGTGLKAYLRLLRHRPAAGPFLAALVARLPLAMAPLGILILVQQERGAYAIAGLVTGAYAVGSALGTPVWGRSMDRFGPRRVLLPTSLVSAGFLASVALAAVGGASNLVLIVLAAGAGLAYPPMSPALRAAFRVVFPDPAARKVAFALDGTSVELVFVGGPLLLSLLLLFGVPVLPLLATAALMAGGGVAYCRTDASRRLRPHGSAGDQIAAPVGPRTALAATGVAAVLVVMLILSIGFGQLDTSMAATAGQVLGSTDRVGILFAAIAGGSTIGGLVFGARTWRFEERQAVPVLLGVFAILLAALAIMLGVGFVHLGALLPLLFLTGLTIAPTLIMQQALLDSLSPAHRLNEAQAFLSASNTTGAAAGTALAGILIDLHGVPWSFGGAALGVAGAAVIALLSQSHWRVAAAEAAQAEVAPTADGPTPGAQADSTRTL